MAAFFPPSLCPVSVQRISSTGGEFSSPNWMDRYLLVKTPLDKKQTEEISYFRLFLSTVFLPIKLPNRILKTNMKLWGITQNRKVLFYSKIDILKFLFELSYFEPFLPSRSTAEV